MPTPRRWRYEPERRFIPEAIVFAAFDQALAAQCLAPLVLDEVPAVRIRPGDEAHFANVILATIAVTRADRLVAARAAGGLLGRRGRSVGRAIDLVFPMW